MFAELTATIENGVLKPDGVLPFPEQTRVRLTIEPVEVQSDAASAWDRLQQFMDKHPITGLAGKFSRAELHERD